MSYWKLLVIATNPAVGKLILWKFLGPTRLDSAKFLIIVPQEHIHREAIVSWLSNQYTSWHPVQVINSKGFSSRVTMINQHSCCKPVRIATAQSVCLQHVFRLAHCVTRHSNQKSLEDCNSSKTNWNMRNQHFSSLKSIVSYIYSKICSRNCWNS